VVRRPDVVLKFAKQSYSSIPEQIDRFLAGIIVAGGNNSKWKRNTLLGPNEKFPFPGDVKCNLAQHMPAASSATTATANKEIAEKPKCSKISPEYSQEHGKCITMTLAEFNRKYLYDTRAANYKPTKFTEELKCSRKLELKIGSCPRLLERELRQLFTEMDSSNRDLTILSLTNKTEVRGTVSSTSDEELSKAQQAIAFIEAASYICERLRFAGYWADFIDPMSGRPYLGRFIYDSRTSNDLANKYELLGFEITKVGHCTVIKNLSTNRAFIGSIFTDAPSTSKILEKIAKKIS